MLTGLVRHQKCRALHLIPFSCDRRRPLLADSNGYSSFEHELESVRALRTRCRRIRAPARARSSAPGRAAQHIARNNPAAVATEHIKKAEQNRRPVLAAPLLRLQRVERREEAGEAPPYSSQPGQAWTGRKIGRLALVQFSSLRDGSGWQSGDPVTMDRSTSGATENTGRSSVNLCFPPSLRMGHPYSWPL